MRASTVLGFTLIEVLLALSVFSLAGLALLNTADTHFTGLNQLEDKMMADWIASNQLVEAHLTEQWPPKNNKKGQLELAGRQWYWLQKVVKTTDNDMRAIEVEVRLDEKSELALTSLMTYVSKKAGK